MRVYCFKTQPHQTAVPKPHPSLLPPSLPHQSTVGMIGEHSTKGEGLSDIGKVDEYQRGDDLQANGSTEVTAIQVVAASHILDQPTERPAEVQV